MSETPTKPEKPERKIRRSSELIGSFIVDAVFQFLLTLWLGWIMFRISPDTECITWLFWLGATLFYTSLHTYHKLMAGRLFVFHVFILILLSTFVWIFK